MAPRRRLAPDSGADLPLALAFEVVRRHRIGELTHPRSWLEPIIGTASPPRIFQEAEAQLAGKRPVDLGHWVMSDMPSHEAGFIDDRSDLIRAAILGAVLSSTTGRQERLTVGPTLFSLRERVLRELDALRERANEHAREYEIADMAERLVSLRSGLQQAFDAYERVGREALLASDVDQQLAETLILEAMTAEWSAGFPRALLSSAGSIELGSKWDRTMPALTVSQLELKEFFVAGAIEESTMRMMGSAWARAFLAGETRELFARFERAPARSWRLRSLRDRILRAIDALAGRGERATHIIGSANWHLWNDLERDGALTGNRRQTDGFIGTAFGLSVYEGHEDLDGLVVLSLPKAVLLTQHLIDGKVFEVSIRNIDDEVEAELRRLGNEDADGGPGDSPSERLRLRTWVLLREAAVIRVRPEAFVRVTVPDSQQS